MLRNNGAVLERLHLEQASYGLQWIYSEFTAGQSVNRTNVRTNVRTMYGPNSSSVGAHEAVSH